MCRWLKEQGTARRRTSSYTRSFVATVNCAWTNQETRACEGTPRNRKTCPSWQARAGLAMQLDLQSTQTVVLVPKSRVYDPKLMGPLPHLDLKGFQDPTPPNIPVLRALRPAFDIVCNISTVPNLQSVVQDGPVKSPRSTGVRGPGLVGSYRNLEPREGEPSTLLVGINN